VLGIASDLSAKLYRPHPTTGPASRPKPANKPGERGFDRSPPAPGEPGLGSETIQPTSRPASRPSIPASTPAEPEKPPDRRTGRGVSSWRSRVNGPASRTAERPPERSGALQRVTVRGARRRGNRRSAVERAAASDRAPRVAGGGCHPPPGARS